MSQKEYEYYEISWTGMDQYHHDEILVNRSLKSIKEYATILEEHGAQLITIYDSEGNVVER